MRCLEPPFQLGGKTIHRIPEAGARHGSAPRSCGSRDKSRAGRGAPATGRPPPARVRAACAKRGRKTSSG